MPSRTLNSGIFITPKNGSSTTSLLLIRRTGYANVWIGDQHYYWNYNASQINQRQIDINKAIRDYNDRLQKKTSISVRRT